MKKLIGLVLIIALTASLFATTAFAVLSSDANIDAAKAAVKKAAETNYATNDISMDGYLKLVKSFIPESLEVEVDYSPYGNFFRVTNATPEKEGKVRAQFRFYHQDVSFNESDEYITFKILKTDSVTQPAEEVKTSKFSDVAADAYYFEGVNWAVEEGITSGTSDTTFSPDATCTKAQILTFLWRAAGSPKPSGSNPFSDVKPTDYYYQAALWAHSKKIITGDTFEGDTPCTRAATVTYIWKYEGGYKLKPISRFTDVPADSDFALAVAWAVGRKITSGTSDTTFSPDTTCTRGQIVTFLLRNEKGKVIR